MYPYMIFFISQKLHWRKKEISAYFEALILLIIVVFMSLKELVCVFVKHISIPF